MALSFVLVKDFNSASKKMRSAFVGDEHQGLVTLREEDGTEISLGRVAKVQTAKYRITDATTNAVTLKNSATVVRGIYVANRDTANLPITLKIYDKATTPVPASDPALFPLNVHAGHDEWIPIPGGGLPLAAGLSIAVVRNSTDLDNTAVTAGSVVVIFHDA